MKEELPSFQLSVVLPKCLIELKSIDFQFNTRLLREFTWHYTPCW